MIRCRIGMPRCGICGHKLSTNALANGWKMCWVFYCPIIMVDQGVENPPANEEKKEDYYFFLEPIFRKMRQSR